MTTPASRPDGDGQSVTWRSLLIDVALGNTLPHIAVAHLTSKQEDSAVSGEIATLGIRGTEGMGVTYAKCCCPLPGDAIQGYLGQEKGLMVHRDSCRNLAELREQPDRLISLHWDEEYRAFISRCRQGTGRKPARHDRVTGDTPQRHWPQH